MFPSTWHQAKTFCSCLSVDTDCHANKKNNKIKQEERLIPLHTCLLPFLCGVIYAFLHHDICAPSRTTASSAFLGSLLHNLPLTQHPINSDLIKRYFLYINDQLYLITNLSTTSLLLRLCLFALWSLSSFPFDLPEKHVLFLRVMSSFHWATEFLNKKISFLLPKCLTLYYFLLFKLWFICFLQSSVLRVELVPSLSGVVL